MLNFFCSRCLARRAVLSPDLANSGKGIRRGRERWRLSLAPPSGDLTQDNLQSLEAPPLVTLTCGSTTRCLASGDFAQSHSRSHRPPQAQEKSLGNLGLEGGQGGGPETGRAWQPGGQMTQDPLQVASGYFPLILQALAGPLHLLLSPGFRGSIPWSEEMGTNSKNRPVQMEWGCWGKSKGSREQGLFIPVCSLWGLCLGPTVSGGGRGP